MKKIFTLILFFATIFSVNAQTKKIAYVTKGTPNDAILTYLKSITDFNVITLDIATYSSTIATTITSASPAYDMVIISEWPGSADAGIAELKTLTATKPILFMKTFALKTTTSGNPAWGWFSTTNGQATGFDQTTEATVTGVTVTNTSHPIFTGVNTSNTVNLINSVSSSKGLTWVDPSKFISVTGGTISNLANVSGAKTAGGNYDATNQAIFEVPVGTTVSGTLVSQKFIHIGINQASYPNVSTDGKRIIANACYYLMGLTVPASIPTGIKNNMPENAFSISPNPSNGEFTINFEQKSNDASVEINSMDGRVVYNTSVIKDATLDVDLSNLAPGIYVVTYSSNNMAGSKKVVIK